jgi:predicted site-specific integrase-resolvase
MFHVSKRTLQRYRSEGILPFIKRGQKIYYKKSDVREYANKYCDPWQKKAFENDTKAKENN